MGNQMDRMILALSGVRGSGKTSLLMDLVKALRNHGLTVKGVLEWGIFEGDKKVAIEVLDLAVEESRILARLAEEMTTDLQFGDWTFFPDTFDWANERLMKVDTADAFILDEVGPLELDQGKGLQAGLAVMSTRAYRMGIMTIRPKCLEMVYDLFPNIIVYSMSKWEKETLLNELLRIALSI
jgi:nucleoside-triphosphatase THEP1